MKISKTIRKATLATLLIGASVLAGTRDKLYLVSRADFENTISPGRILREMDPIKYAENHIWSPTRDQISGAQNACYKVVSERELREKGYNPKNLAEFDFESNNRYLGLIRNSNFQ